MTGDCFVHRIDERFFWIKDNVIAIPIAIGRSNLSLAATTLSHGLCYHKTTKKRFLRPNVSSNKEQTFPPNSFTATFLPKRTRHQHKH